MLGAPPLLLLLLGALCARPACAGSHSLRYFYSSLSEGLPRFSIAGYVDDVEIEAYSTESRRLEPRAPWMGLVAASDPQYWERETETARGSEAALSVNVKTVMSRLNHTAGLHVVQRMYGCELLDDGSIEGFRQDAYDGRDFLSFDKENLKYTAAMEAARVTADRWNKAGFEAPYRKAYLEHTCIEWLQKYLKYGKASLLRRVPPQTMISRRKTGSATILNCYAYGFYPREIEVKWVRNLVEVDWKTKTILPNTDGTYQIRITLELPEGHNEKDYRCLVDHIGLEDIITMVYEEKCGTPNIWILVGAIAAALVALGVTAAAIWKRKRAGKETYSSVRRAPDSLSSTSSTVSEGRC